MLIRKPLVLLAVLFGLVCLVTPTLLNQPNFAVSSTTQAPSEAVVDVPLILPLKVDALIADLAPDAATNQATLLKLINAQRVKAGLKKVASNTRLATAATRHSKDMATKNFFSHTGSNGSSMADRITAAGYKFSAAGETIYAGNGNYKTPAACLNAWLNSPGHRSILLSSAYTQVGIGYSFNAKSKYGGYYTADFAKPR